MSETSDRAPTIETLAAAYAEGDVERRRAVVQALTERATPASAEARALLIETLGDSEWRVRREALQLALRWMQGAGGEDLEKALVDAVAQGDNVGLRNAALEVLASRGRAARPLLEEALDRAGTGSAAKFFVEALGASGDRAAVAKLVPLVASPDANLSAAAVGALAQLGGEAAERALMDALESEDSFRRMAALDGLAQLGARVPFAELEPLVGDRFVRRAAVPLLGRSEAPEAAALLMGVLRSTGSSETIERVAKALLELGQRVGDGALVPHLGDVTHRLRKLATTGSAAGRRAAVHLLVLARDEGSLMEITQLAGEDELLPHTLAGLEAWGSAAVVPLLHVVRSTVGMQRARALELAAALTPGEGAPELQRSLVAVLRDAAKASEAALRITALRAFAPHATPGDLDWLIHETTRDEGTAGAAVVALERLAERAPDAVRERLREVSFEGEGARVATLAARLLGEAVLDELQAGLSSQRPGFRAACVAALGEISAPRAAEMVAFALMDEDARVRETAAHVLGSLRGEGGEAVGVDALVAALSSEDDALRATAAHALGDAGSAGDEAVVPALLSAAHTAGPMTVAAALGALERIAPSAAEGLLDEALSNPEPAVAERALGVAASLGGDAVVGRLVTALGHPVWHVRVAAARWLGERSEVEAREALLARQSVEDDASVRAAIDDALEQIEG